MKHLNRALLTLGVIGPMAAHITAPASAATVGYWRLGDDGGILADSSGNGNTLTAQGASGLGAGTVPTQVNLGSSGPGSAFSDPIPQTQATNDLAADFNGTSGGDRLYVADPFDSSLDFTVEAYLNLGSTNSRTQYFVSQYYTGSVDPGTDPTRQPNRSWALGIADNDGTGAATANSFFLLLSGDGTSTTILPVGITPDLGDDYYLAVRFDNSSAVGDVQFTYQNLTDATPLTTVTLSSGIESLFDARSEIQLGAYNQNQNNFDGLLDEVRLSTGQLSDAELLITVPEPAGLWLLAGGSVLVARRRRSA